MQQTCSVITNIYVPETAFREHMGIKVQRFPLGKMQEKREELLKISKYSLEGEIICIAGETIVEIAGDVYFNWMIFLNAFDRLCESREASEELSESNETINFKIPENDSDTIFFHRSDEQQNIIQCDRKLFLSALLDGAADFFQTLQDAMADVDLTQYPLCGEPRDPKEYQFDNILEWIDQLRGQLLQS